MAGTGHLLPWPTSQSVRRRRALMRNQMRWMAFPEPNRALPWQAGLPKAKATLFTVTCVLYVCVFCHYSSLRTTAGRCLSEPHDWRDFSCVLFWFLSPLPPIPPLTKTGCVGARAGPAAARAG